MKLSVTCLLAGSKLRRPILMGCWLTLLLLFSLLLREELGPAEGAVPGANGKIAFFSLRSGNGEIYAMDPDGGHIVNLTNNPAYDDQPAWSPDGAQVAFIRSIDDYHDIFIMDADGNNQRNVSNTPDLVETHPAWSPDGKRIAFERFTEHRSGIYVVNVDGTGEVYLSAEAQGVDHSPAWSPDGTKIAFVSSVRSQEAGYEIFVMSPDGSERRNLTQSPLSDDAPSWSPDGDKIVFQSDRDRNDEIYVMKVDGSAQVNLTNDPSALFDQHPAWSPDGSKIAFTSEYDIYLMSPDGTGKVNLTNEPGVDDFPDWQPLPVKLPPTGVGPSGDHSPAQRIPLLVALGALALGGWLIARRQAAR